MGFYLIDRPNPYTAQCRHPRRAPLSGTVSVHTAEGALDAIAPDTGAENIAGFIGTRRDYGSYHVIVDSDSVVAIAPDDYETWNVAESDAFGQGMNSHVWGISAACRSVEWDPDTAWTQTVIRKMGAEIRAFWSRNGWNPDDPNVCRWLTRDEARRRQPGLVHHGVVQPSDRSDAWALHPRRAELDAMLIAAIRQDQPPPEPEEDIMATKEELEAIVAAQADRVIAAMAKPEDSLWMGTSTIDDAVYIVANSVKFHVPGGANEEETNLRISTLEKLGFDNRGIQDLALASLPEAPFRLEA